MVSSRSGGVETRANRTPTSDHRNFAPAGVRGTGPAKQEAFGFQPFECVQSTLMQLLSEVAANVTMAVAFTTAYTPAGVGGCWIESAHSL